MEHFLRLSLPCGYRPAFTGKPITRDKLHNRSNCRHVRGIGGYAILINDRNRNYMVYGTPDGYIMFQQEPIAVIEFTKGNQLCIHWNRFKLSNLSRTETVQGELVCNMMGAIYLNQDRQ